MEPFRVVVSPQDCDALGHLNMVRYFGFCDQSGTLMKTKMGWPPGEANNGRRYSLAIVHSESEFLAEVHDGQALLVRSGVSSIGTKSAVIVHLITLEDGTPVFRSKWKSALLNLDTRRAVAVPDDMRAVMQEFELQIDA